MVDRLGVSPYMTRIDGNRSGAGDRKAAHLADHLGALRTGAAGSDGFVMIGDSLDDGRAAADNGIDCVMFDSGSHHRHELESTGFPVADSLLEAIALCGIR
jgi:phosphoglycolate phosphatase-like HAD superfamily hydrolase